MGYLGLRFIIVCIHMVSDADLGGKNEEDIVVVQKLNVQVLSSGETEKYEREGKTMKG